MISWDVSTRVKASLAVGVVAACAVSGVSLAASGSTPAPVSAASTATVTDPTLYNGMFPVDTSAKAVAANDAALAREVGPSGELRAAAKTGLQGLAASTKSSLESISRETMMTEAAQWIRDKVPYCQTRLHEGYRMDCSGFVSMAWKLAKPGRTTFNLSEVSAKISAGELQKGDIALNTQRHVMLFAGWSDSSKTVGVWWHSTSSNGTCPMSKGAVVTSRSIASLSAGGYHFRTRKSLVTTAKKAAPKPTTPPPARVTTTPEPVMSAPRIDPTVTEAPEFSDVPDDARDLD